MTSAFYKFLCSFIKFDAVLVNMYVNKHKYRSLESSSLFCDKIGHKIPKGEPKKIRKPFVGASYLSFAYLQPRYCKSYQ